MRLLSRLSLAVILGAAGLMMGSGAATGVAADDPPPIEEDYSYPGAAKIFQERGILLKKGDGRILLVDCVSGSDFVEALSQSKGRFCFRVTGPTGYLTMELPQAYMIKADMGHTLQATVTVKGRTEKVTVPKNEWRPVGQGGDPGSNPATLVELRAST